MLSADDIQSGASRRREPPLLQCHPEQAIVCDCASKFCAVRHERNKTEERRRKAASDEGIYKGVSVSFRGRLLFRKGRRTINVHMRSRRFASPYGFDSATASRFAPLRMTQHFSHPTSPSGFALTSFAVCGRYLKRRQPPTRHRRQPARSQHKKIRFFFFTA